MQWTTSGARKQAAGEAGGRERPFSGARLVQGRALGSWGCEWRAERRRQGWQGTVGKGSSRRCSSHSGPRPEEGLDGERVSPRLASTGGGPPSRHRARGPRSRGRAPLTVPPMSAEQASPPAAVRVDLCRVVHVGAVVVSGPPTPSLSGPNWRGPREAGSCPRKKSRKNSRNSVETLAGLLITESALTSPVFKADQDNQGRDTARKLYLQFLDIKSFHNYLHSLSYEKIF